MQPFLMLCCWSIWIHPYKATTKEIKGWAIEWRGRKGMPGIGFLFPPRRGKKGIQFSCFRQSHTDEGCKWISTSETKGPFSLRVSLCEKLDSVIKGHSTSVICQMAMRMRTRTYRSISSCKSRDYHFLRQAVSQSPWNFHRRKLKS